MRSASTSTASWSARSVQSTTNSSPPSRATRSCSRTVARSSRATCTSSSSPASCPRLSLTVLKRSRSRNSSVSSPGWRLSRCSPASRCSRSSVRLASPVSGSCSACAARRASNCLRSVMSRRTPVNRPIVGADLADREVERERRAVAPLADDLPADADDAPLPGAAVPVEVAVVLGAVGRRHEHADVAADDLGRRVAEHALRAGFIDTTRPAGVDGEDASTAVSRTARARCSLCEQGRGRRLLALGGGGALDGRAGGVGEQAEQGEVVLPPRSRRAAATTASTPARSPADISATAATGARSAGSDWTVPCAADRCAAGSHGAGPPSEVQPAARAPRLRAQDEAVGLPRQQDDRAVGAQPDPQALQHLGERCVGVGLEAADLGDALEQLQRAGGRRCPGLHRHRPPRLAASPLCADEDRTTAGCGGLHPVQRTRRACRWECRSSATSPCPVPSWSPHAPRPPFVPGRRPHDPRRRLLGTLLVPLAAEAASGKTTICHRTSSEEPLPPHHGVAELAGQRQPATAPTSAACGRRARRRSGATSCPDETQGGTTNLEQLDDAGKAVWHGTTKNAAAARPAAASAPLTSSRRERALGVPVDDDRRRPQRPVGQRGRRAARLARPPAVHRRQPEPLGDVSATTSAATAVTGTTATLHGTVALGPTTASSSSSSGTDPLLLTGDDDDAAAPSSTSGRRRSAPPLSGLQPATQYFFRVLATTRTGHGRGGRAGGRVLSFTTPAGSRRRRPSTSRCLPPLSVGPATAADADGDLGLPVDAGLVHARVSARVSGLTVTPLAVGTCTLTADQPGDAT